MVTDIFTTSLMPLAGGGLLGFAAGWALKKVAKLAFIALGLLVLLIGYLEYQKWISVNWVVVENQTQTMNEMRACK
jgi:uncharacterized membrane protein (Fun14 family)